MSTSYNRIANQNVGRLAALSDGIFAVAMTLLVLDLRAPSASAVRDERGLIAALGAIAPQLVMFALSFLTLGILWAGQQTQLNHVDRGDRHFTWIHMAFLFTVSTLPFSTKLLAEFIGFRVALIFYWLNIAAAGMSLYAGWRYAVRSALVSPDLPPEVDAAIRHRIKIAQALYAFGASLCFISTRLSLAFIVLVQLNYAFAPGFARRPPA